VDRLHFEPPQHQSDGESKFLAGTPVTIYVKVFLSGARVTSALCTSVSRQPTVHRRQSRSYYLLTDREKEVVHLLAEGRSNKEVAALLDLGLSTVETHRSNLMQKLNLHNTAEIALYAVRKRIIS